MVTDTLSPAQPLRTLRIGVLLALLAAAVDIVGLLAFGLPNAPVAVNLVTSALAVATLAGAVGAWRGAAWGVWLAAVSRALSALSVVPLFVAPEAPKEAIPLSVAVLALTVLAIALLFAGLAGRRRVG
ncbi:MAG: hypothetical protein DI534_07945 [Leifsonia xyli]|nr:MAG: hypothetical protein DI534_07945 [Leifsonia xyli]